MLSEPAKYALVASMFIAIMFVLFTKVTKKIIDMRRPIPIESVTARGENDSVNPDNPLVYPIYVDCSFELLPARASSGLLPPGAR